MGELQIGDLVELDGKSGVVVGVDHRTGRVTVRWLDDDGSRSMPPGRVRLVKPAARGTRRGVMSHA